jgi:glycosyltransferase involved in cell wall biosynthesis
VSNELFVVMPVYNEAETIRAVVEEWLPVLRTATKRFTLCCLDDGSRDASPRLLDELASEHPEVRVVHKQNSGHGDTCRQGYRLALDSGAEWIFQIDSDGQCDPAYLSDLWSRREDGDAVFGFRRIRDDGRFRWLVSQVLRAVTWAGSGVRVRDANVPYRLMHLSALAAALDSIPSEFTLVNVALTVQLERQVGIRWQEIRFRERGGGATSQRLPAFGRQGLEVFRQLRRLPR